MAANRSKLTKGNRALQARVVELEASLAELDQAYRALQAQQEKSLVTEKLAAVGRLTAGLANEINTPLAAARASLSELAKLVHEYQTAIDDPGVKPDGHRAIAKDMQEAVRLADSALERIAGFVRNVRAQTRDLAPQERIRFNAVHVIQETLLATSHALNQAGCSATFYHAVDDVWLYGSPDLFARVVTNLLTNAIDASLGRGGAVISLRLTPRGDGAEVVVSDVGSGIPPEVMPKIFDPMFTTKRFGESLGLGLTLVHYIVTGEFGGTIGVTSQPGHGTTFSLHFPRSAES